MVPLLRLLLLSVALLNGAASAFMVTSPCRLQTQQQMAPSSFGYKDGYEAPVVPSFLKPEIATIESLDDFLTFLSQDERLVVVKFYASWCKSCQKFGVMYKKLALDEGDVMDFKTKELVRKGKVRFAEIEFGTNAVLCRSLGVKRLPNVHIYKGAVGLVTAFPCGPNKFTLLEEKLANYKKMTDEELANEHKMEEGGALGDSIVTELSQEHWEEAMLKEKQKLNMMGPSP